MLRGGGVDPRTVVELVLEVEEEVPDLHGVHAQRLARIADGVILHVDERGQLVHVQFLETVVHLELEDEVGEILLRLRCRSLHLGTQDVGTALAVEWCSVVGQVTQHVEHVALF